MHFLVQLLIILPLLTGRLFSAEPNSSLVEAVDGEYVLRQWQTADGLPQNTVSALGQTPDGYLWLGTFNGLARFDGVRFKVFNVKNTPELISDYVTRLLVLSDGRLCITTDGGGVTFYEHGKFRKPSGQEDLDLLDVVEGVDGELWLSSMRRLFRYKNGTFSEMAKSLPDLYPFRGLAVDSRGVLWVATKRGLHRLENGVLVGDGAEAETVGMTIKQNELVCFQHSSGLVKRSDNFQGVLLNLSRAPEILSWDRKGRLWFGGNGNALTFQHRERWYTFASTSILLEHDITALLVDRDENIWVGLDGAGVVRLRHKKVISLAYGDAGAKLDNTVTVTADASGRIWTGRLGSRASMNWVDPETFRVQNGPELFRSIWAASVLGGRDGRVWIGTFGHGLFWWEHEELKHQMLGKPPYTATTGNVVRVLYEDSKGGLWVGTDSLGAEHFSGTALEQVRRFDTRNGLRANKITAIAESPDGSIWLGSTAGIHRVSSDGKIRVYDRHDGLGANFVHCAYVDSQGVLWVGTAGGGLSRLKGDQFITMGTEHGLLHDVVAQIIEDDYGDLWIGTNLGISKLRREELETFAAHRTTYLHPVSFGSGEGLVKEECGGGFQPACLKDGSGRLWFCTVGGLAIIDPAQTVTPMTAPKVAIEEAVVDGLPILLFSVDELALRVPAGSTTLEIGFTGIDLSAPERVSFSYMLEGYDESWVNAGKRRSAFYTKIPPGLYRFRARAANDEGDWHEEPTELLVEVLPRWFETNSFRMGVGFVMLASVFGGYAVRVQKQRLERRRRESFAKKLIESQENERQRVSRELHDSLGQSLLVIKNRAFVAMQETPQSSPLRAQLQAICEATGDAVQEVRQISQALRPPQLDRLGLTRTIEGLVKQIGEIGDFAIETAIQEIDDALPASDQIHLLRIVQECLNNILKHSKASTIRIQIRHDGDLLVVNLADDGCGFDPQVQIGKGKSMGLNGITERVHILGGFWTIESAVAEGTRITIRIPIRNS